MNIIDIVKNAPEGATHYGVNSKGEVASYYKLLDFSGEFYTPAIRGKTRKWRALRGSPAYSAIPLPNLKTEWVRVEGSIFDLAPELKAGELYFDFNGDESNKQPIKTESLLVFLRSLHHSIYRKIEKVIDEKQEFEVKFNKMAKEHFNSGTEETWTDYLYSRGCRFIELD